MPEGLAVLKWDDELGPVVTSKTPKGLKVGLDPTTSMRVYGIATLGETEEAQKPGFTSLSFPEFRLAVYYGGLNMHLRGLPSMVFLVLSPDEDPDAYKDALPEIATQIFLNAEGDVYAKQIPKMFKQISRYTQMTPEQRQASVVNDPVRRAILQTLMKNGTIQATNLEQLVFEEVGKKIDIDMVLRPLVKMGVLATGWVEGLSSEVIYLTRAVFIIRSIPRDTVKSVQSTKFPKDVSDEYLRIARRYHRDYVARLRRDLNETLWFEAEELSKYILDFEAYDIISALREGPLVRELLEERMELSNVQVTRQLKSLESANIIMRITDDGGTEHILLKCDPEVLTVYPEWLIERTVDLYNDEDIPSRQAIHYLETLKSFHPGNTEQLLREVE